MKSPPKEEDIPEGHFRCNGPCDMVFPMTKDHFYGSTSRVSGFAKLCKACSKLKREERENDEKSGYVLCRGECGEMLVLNRRNFSRKSSSRSGLTNICRCCARERKRRHLDRKKRQACDFSGEVFAAGRKKEKLEYQACSACRGVSLVSGADILCRDEFGFYVCNECKEDKDMKPVVLSSEWFE